MSTLVDHSYWKTIGISLLLHALVLAVLILTGLWGQMVSPPSEVAAIEVVPAKVLEAPLPLSKAAAVPSSLSQELAPSVPQSTASLSPSLSPSRTNPVQASSSAPLPDALPGESAQSVAVPTTSGQGTVVHIGTIVGKRKAGSGGNVTGGNGMMGGGGNCGVGVVYRPEPGYPFEARKAKQEGTVGLRVFVDDNGNATVTVNASSGYQLLDNAAVSGVRRWRFSPARKGGEAISSYKDFHVKFRLTDGVSAY